MYLAAAFIGFWIFGPFLTSTAYKAMLEQVAASPLLGHLLDPEDWILDHFIQNLIPLLFIWTCAFASYRKFKDRVKDLNIYFGYISRFTSPIGKFLVTLFMFFCGIGMYSLFVLCEAPVGIRIIYLTLIGFGLPGLFFNYYSKIVFNPSRLLDTVAPSAALVFGVLSALAIFYSTTADFLKLIRFLLKHG